MEIKLSPINLLQVLPIFIGFYFAIQLFLIRNYKVKSNRWLGVFFLCIVWLLGVMFLGNIGVFETEDSEKSIITVIAVLSFAVVCVSVPPTLYFYVVSLRLPKKLTIKNTIFHYIPSIFVLFVNTVVLALADENIVPASYEWFHSFTTDLIYYTNAAAIFVVFGLQNIIYVVISFVSYRKHKRNIGHIFSYEEGIDLKWTRIFILSYFIFVVGIYILQITKNKIASVPFNLFTLAYLSFIGYSGSRQLDIFLGIKQSNDMQDDIPEEVSKKPLVVKAHQPATMPSKENLDEPTEQEDSSNTIQEEVIQTIQQELLKVMETERPYLNTQLTVYDLAKQVNTNTKYLSKVINSQFEQSFVNFINSYRIEEAQRLLEDTEFHHLKIEAIAEMTGFKSKSAFNTAFKKNVGLTPSGYRSQFMSSTLYSAN